jgi:hypothetical protein
MSDELVPRLRKELDALLTRLRQELVGKTANSPEAWKLLRDATVEIGQLRAALVQATMEIELLQAKLARRRPPDDDGVPEVVPVGPPKRPHGGSPAFATRLNDGGELAPSVQYKVPTVPEADKDISDRAASFALPSTAMSLPG